MSESVTTVWKRVLLALVAVAVVAGAFLAGYFPRRDRQTVLAGEAKAEAKAIPVVNVAKVVRAPATADLVLPGTMQAIAEAAVMARASGYLKRRLVDIGDMVSAGQVLAEIEATELDQQIRQASSARDQAAAVIEQGEAALRLARSNQNIARLTAERWRALEARGAVSKQENDNYQAVFEAQSANVQAAEKSIAAARGNLGVTEASLARLVQLKSYQQVRAPFGGVITVRNIEAGMLVNEGSTLLFRVAQTGRLRVYVNVPQSDFAAVKPGMTASITVQDAQSPPVEGVVTRTANALDPASRTMLTEIQAPNEARRLAPGMFVMVAISRTLKNPPLLIPGDTLVVRSDGPQVAVVNEEGRVHFQAVKLGRDLGQRLQVIGGIEEGDTVVVNPGDTAKEGVRVKPVLVSDKPAGNSSKRAAAE